MVDIAIRARPRGARFSRSAVTRLTRTCQSRFQSFRQMRRLEQCGGKQGKSAKRLCDEQQSGCARKTPRARVTTARPAKGCAEAPYYEFTGALSCEVRPALDSCRSNELTARLFHSKMDIQHVWGANSQSSGVNRRLPLTRNRRPTLTTSLGVYLLNS